MLVRAGFAAMHAVLWHFVDAAGGRLDLLPIKMIERRAPFAGRVTFLNRFGNVSLRKHRRFAQRPAFGELRRNR